MEREEKRVVDTYRQGPAGKEQPELDGLRGGREAEEKAEHENGGRGRLPKTTDGPREPGPSSSRAGCRKRASDSTTGAWGPLTSRAPRPLATAARVVHFPIHFLTTNPTNIY